MRLGTTLSVTQPGRRRLLAVSGGGGSGGSGGGSGGSGSGFVTTNLVASYDAGDTNSYSGTGTTWSDLTSNSNDLTLTNGPVFSATDGGTIEFDGSNDYALSSNSVTISGDFSFDAWVYLDTTASGYDAIFSIGGYSLTSGLALFGPYLSVWSNGGQLGYASTFATAAWKHVALTRSGSTNTLYLDGSSVGTFTNSNTFSGSIGLGAGFWTTNPGNYLPGKISNARLYNGTALTSTEVTQNYNAGDPSTRTSGGGGGSSVVTTNLIAHVDAGDTNSYGGTGTTWSDLTSNSNDLTLINGPVYSSSTDGGVFTFDGTNDRAETSNNVSLSGDFSFDAWINADPGGGTLFSIGSHNLTSGLRIVGGTAFGGATRYYFQVTTGNSLVYNGPLIASDPWAHVALVRSGSTCTLYLNKTSITTFTNSATLSGIFRLGASKVSNLSNYELHLPGKISNARLYDGTALSATEVTQNYDALSGRF